MNHRIRAGIVALVTVLAGLITVGTAPSAHAEPATTCMNPSISGSASKLIVRGGGTALLISASGYTPASCPDPLTTYSYSVRFDVPGGGDVTTTATGTTPLYNYFGWRVGTRINFQTTIVGAPSFINALHQTKVSVSSKGTPIFGGRSSEDTRFYLVPSVGSYDTEDAPSLPCGMVYPFNYGKGPGCP